MGLHDLTRNTLSISPLFLFSYPPFSFLHLNRLDCVHSSTRAESRSRVTAHFTVWLRMGVEGHNPDAETQHHFITGALQ